MYDSILIINKEEHSNSCVKTLSNLSFANKLNNCLLALDEYFEACKDYPILFAKDSNGIWYASALLGTKDGENLFIDANEFWEARRYVPAFVRRYPFVFATMENKALVLALDDQYIESKNDSNLDRALFNENGEPSKLVSLTLDFMNNYQMGLENSKAFIDDLDSLGILEQKSVSFTSKSGEEFVINGFYIVNEEKFHHLSEKKRENICKKGIIPFITAHLISLSNINKFPLKA